MPDKWNALWKLLLKTHSKNGDGQEPPQPLILGAWNYTSDTDKRERLREHIMWADSHGAIEQVAQFLRGLDEEQWLTEPQSS